MSNLILNNPPLVLSPDDKAKEMRKKFDAIKDNQRRLDACPKHRFPEWPEILSMGTKFTCEHCKAYIDAIHAYSYVMGYKAAGGEPSDVIPTWYETFGKGQQAKSIVKGDHFAKEETT